MYRERNCKGRVLGCFVLHIHYDARKLAWSYEQPMLELRCSRLQLQRQESLLRRLSWFPSPRVVINVRNPVVGPFNLADEFRRSCRAVTSSRTRDCWSRPPHNGGLSLYLVAARMGTDWANRSRLCRAGQPSIV